MSIIKSANPVSRPIQPRFHEGSGLRSPTDGDALMRQWRKDMRVGESTFALAVNMAKMSREIEKLRRRIIGGGTSTPPATPSGGTYQGNWNPGTPYKPGAIVRGVNATVTIGTTTYTLQPGIYGCVVTTLPALAAGWSSNMLPLYPEPGPTMGNGIVYWHLLSFSAIVVNTCANGQKIIYINASGSF